MEQGTSPRGGRKAQKRGENDKKNLQEIIYMYIDIQRRGRVKDYSYKEYTYIVEQIYITSLICRRSRNKLVLIYIYLFIYIFIDLNIYSSLIDLHINHACFFID